MARKKASIEVQFNWIFVMVAGALILVFFFGVIQKQRDMSNSKMGNMLLTNLESIATRAGVSKGTVQTIELPNIEINFGCTDECLCSYSIGDVQKQYRDKIVFAPERIKGSGMILWTLDWKVPFRVTNFVFATTTRDKYFFVYENLNSQLIKVLNKTMPAEVDAEFIHFTEYPRVKNKNYNSAKFIFIDTIGVIPPGTLGIDNSFRNVDVSAVHISSGGDLVFYDKGSNRKLEFIRKESSYYGEPSIYGAIFASDSNAYDCNMVSGLVRMGKILEIFIAKSEYFDEENNKALFCVEGYSTENLEILKRDSETAQGNMQSLKLLSSSVSAVDAQNEVLLRASCPLLY